MSGANYNGRQPNNTSYIKTFVLGDLGTSDLWTTTSLSNNNAITPSNNSLDLYIPANILLGGQIIYTTGTNNINSTTNNTNNTNNSVTIANTMTNQCMNSICTCNENCTNLEVRISSLENEIIELKNQLKNLLSTNIND